MAVSSSPPLTFGPGSGDLLSTLWYAPDGYVADAGVMIVLVAGPGSSHCTPVRLCYAAPHANRLILGAAPPDRHPLTRPGPSSSLGRSHVHSSAQAGEE